MLKRITSMIIALLIVIGSGACSGGDEKVTKADDYSMTNTPSYDEKEFGAAIGLQSPGIKIGLDSKDQIVLNDYREKGTFCIIADGSGKKLQESKNDTDDSSTFTFDAQDNRYVINEKYSAEYEANKSREVAYTLNIYNSKGEKQKSFDLGKQTVSNEQAGITDIAVDSKGTLYVLVKRQFIEVIGSDGKKVKDIPAQKTDFIEIDNEDNLLIGSFDGGDSSSSIENRNPAKDDSMWAKKLAAGHFMREMKYSLKNKTLYILTEKGILSCSTDGNIGGYIFDFKQSSLLKSGVNISDFVFDCDKNIYVLAFKIDSSSGTKTTPLFYKYTTIKDQQKPKNQKTLTIALRYSEKFIEAAISKFQQEHPDINVEIKDYSAATMGTSEEEKNRAQKAEEDFQKVISTELMAGNGADIIDVLDLPYNKFAEKNVLLNLSETINNDKSFDLGKYQQNLINACKYKDNLYIMPINFSFSTLLANKNIMNKEGIKIDSTKWTWKEFISIAQKITKDNNGDGKPDQYALPKMTANQIFRRIYDGEYSSFIDLDKKTASFDSSKFVEILNFAKDFAAKNLCNPTLDSSKLYQFTDPGTIGFMQGHFSAYQSIIMDQSLFNGEVEYLDMPSYNGKGNPKSIIPYRTFAINNKSEMKSEAWEFMKVLLSDEIQSNPEMYYFPVNINSLKEMAKTTLSNNYMYDYYKNKGRNVKRLTQADIDLVNKMISELKTNSYSDPQIDDIISDGVKEFFSGKKTAEETAKLIQNKINIYLGE